MAKGFLLDFILINPYKMDAFLKKVDQVAVVDTSKLNMFLLKEKALEFTRIKSENPNFTQVTICKMMGISDSTMRRVRNDLGIPSPFRRNNTKSKNMKKNTKKNTESKNTKSKNTESKNTESKKVSKFKNINRDYLASGIEDEEDTEEEIKTENQMNKLFQDKK